jgi:hypothetical protein
MRTGIGSRFAPLLALTSGCFVIAQARTARQAELGAEYVLSYGNALRLAKDLDADPAKATSQTLADAIRAAEGCQGTVIGKLDESINDAGSMLYEEPTKEGFDYGGLHVPLATAFGHCRQLQRTLLRREVRACPAKEGTYLENFVFGHSTGKELRGMTDWTPGVCILNAPQVIDPAGKLSAEEVAKARTICDGAVSFRVFEQGPLVKHDATTHFKRTPVRCEKAPVTVRGASVPRAVPLPPFDSKCPNCADWDRASTAGELRPTLLEAFARTPTATARLED